MTTVIPAKPPPPRVSTHFHTFSDRSIMRKMPAKDLIRIPIWQGNRLLCEEHKQQIQDSIKGNIKSLDLKPYHIITYPVDEDHVITYKSFIIDGQHRVAILREAFYDNPEHENFECIVIERACQSETDAIEYFKILNTTKAVEWKHDPNLVANTFIKALEKEYNVGKLRRVRPAGAHRPYLSVEKFREAICRRGFEGKSVEAFITTVRRLNSESLERLKTAAKKSTREVKAVELGFCLALDEKFKWLDLV